MSILVVSNAPTGSIVMYATGANSVADDGTGKNGLFTDHLINNLKTPGLSVFELFDKTMDDVIKVSNGRQHPELSLRFPGATSTYIGTKMSGSPPTPNAAAERVQADAARLAADRAKAEADRLAAELEREESEARLAALQRERENRERAEREQAEQNRKEAEPVVAETSSVPTLPSVSIAQASASALPVSLLDTASSYDRNEVVHLSQLAESWR